MHPPSKRHVIGQQWFATDDQSRVRLRVSENPTDGSRWFPPLESLGTLTELPAIEIGPSGVAYASTVVRVGPARFEPPYVLTYVDVDGVRILAHSPGETPLRPGTPVELVLDRVGAEAPTAHPGHEPGPSIELWSYTATPVTEGTTR
ncbi:OB-fold domain-containing protein [Kribbella sp. NPDC050820]|uniref:OB-fold domain-containing protein n=1 Tax=Kribbella sp. NPDC050820 TaxID=3155408 RepID=UPI0033F7583E